MTIPAAVAHEDVALNFTRRQLSHINLGVTSIYLQGIHNAEIIATVHAETSPMIPATAARTSSVTTAGRPLQEHLWFRAAWPLLPPSGSRRATVKRSRERRRSAGCCSSSDWPLRADGRLRLLRQRDLMLADKPPRVTKA
jgi:hypothetical protein